jgi:hypothetical protein
VTIPVALVRNTFLMGHLKLPIWGGRVILNGARIRDPLKKTREVTLGLRLNHLDFSEVTKAFVPLALHGSLEGSFPEIRLSPDSLVIRGSLTAHTLGGRIEVSNMKATSPFSNLPKVSMDVLLKDIHLEEPSLASLLPSAIVNWKLSGAMVFDLALKTGVPQLSEEPRVHLGVQLKNGAFSSPDETILGEGIQGEIHATVNNPAHQVQPVLSQGRMTLNAGEILLGSFYFNLQHDPLNIRLLRSGAFPRHWGSSLSVHFHVPTIGDGTITATLENPVDPRGVAEIALGPISNERAFDLFVREPFNSRFSSRLRCTGMARNILDGSGHSYSPDSSKRGEDPTPLLPGKSQP